VNEVTYLNTETTVDLRDALVIFPDDAELEDPFGDLNNHKRFFILRISGEEGL
jgi:hypothetical protein